MLWGKIQPQLKADGRKWWKVIEHPYCNFLKSVLIRVHPWFEFLFQRHRFWEPKLL